MEKTAKGLVEYAKAQLGRPYWYGTFGQAASKSLYNQKKAQYPNYYKWEYANETDKVHDCVGLVKGYLWCDDPNDNTPSYNPAQDKSANQFRDMCTSSGAISTIPDVPGVLVFYNNHMGVYIGSGEVVEARGHKYGVVKTKLSARPWKSWGKHPDIDYDAADAAPVVKLVSVSLPVLKKGAKGEVVRTMQWLLIRNGYDMEGYGADGSFGGATKRALEKFQADNGLEVDASCGRKTWTKLLGME